MLASRLSQFGVEVKRAVNVDVVVGRNTVGFGVRLCECADADGQKLLHVELFNPDHPDSDEMFWVRVMMYFQLVAELGQAGGPSVAGIELGLLRRTQLLGHIGVAFPQKYSALERRTLSVRNARAKNVGVPGASLLEASAGFPDGRTEVGDLDLERFAMATLMGVCELSESEIRGYLEFENKARDHMQELLSKHSGAGEWRTAYKKMNDCLSGVRKNAKDSQRKLLLLLQSACDIQLMHMYQYAAGAVLRTTFVLDFLDPASLVYNTTVHAAQNRLGGIVPAVHPLWPVCLRTPRIVSALRGYAENPASAANINSVNACFLAALSEYIRILEPVMDEDNVEPLDAPAGDGTMTAGDVLGARDRWLSEAEQGIKELIDRIREECGSDGDVAVAYDVVYGGLDVETAAKKHGCSFGEISKRKQKGLVKMKALLQKMGLGCADVLAAFCRCPQDTVERSAPDKNRAEKNDDDFRVITAAPPAFSWDKPGV